MAKRSRFRTLHRAQGMEPVITENPYASTDKKKARTPFDRLKQICTEIRDETKPVHERRHTIIQYLEQLVNQAVDTDQKARQSRSLKGPRSVAMLRTLADFCINHGYPDTALSCISTARRFNPDDTTLADLQTQMLRANQGLPLQSLQERRSRPARPGHVGPRSMRFPHGRPFPRKPK